LKLFGIIALFFALARELTGEAQFERARQQAKADAQTCANDRCSHALAKTDQQIYLETTERRFSGVRRCC
jgi:hypothetical protein